MAELSGFEVLVLAKEIDSALRGTYVNNIYRRGGAQLFRFRRPGGEDVWLVASPKKGAWISSEIQDRDDTTEFTTRLRGELERAKFAGASQLDLDRVFQIDMEGRERLRMVIELMPPGNIIVLDPEGKVRLALSEVRAETRRVVRGFPYLPPGQSRRSPLEVRPEDVEAMLKAETTLGKAIGRHVALPRKYVAEVLNRVGAAEGDQASVFLGRGAEIAKAIEDMVAEARERPRPCVCVTPAGDEVFAFPPSGLDVKEEAGTLSELCDRLFLGDATSEHEQPGPEEVKRRELEATAAKLREEAESQVAEAARARAAAAEAVVGTLESALAAMRGAGVSLQKDPASAAAVASALYDRAKELESKSLRSLETAAKLEKKAAKAPPATAPRGRTLARRRGEWYEKFRWFFTVEGKLAVGGRDAQTNSALLSRHLDSNDTVFHADLFGSPFFILKGGDRQSEEEAREVAQATVAFSSAWKTGLGSADAYWVAPDQVSSAAPSGEYLPRGSFVIRGRKNFISRLIVEVAVGLDQEGRVMAGPEDSVRRRCPRYVVLRPHNEKSSETAKRVLRDLGSDSRGPTLDEVQRALPAGGGKVVRRG
ncbi:MAG: NFACT family protein [Nitrososphaerota archaeon]|nr:NFACT family protein [Nitrososphaerota archaeon]MDG6946247.1 NFACT family protein [Nitrososphaerota archaeon]